MINILHETAVELMWKHSFTEVDKQMLAIIKKAANNAKMVDRRRVSVADVRAAIDDPSAYISREPKGSRGVGLGKGGRKGPFKI
jgi:hypothetical protein